LHKILIVLPDVQPTSTIRLLSADNNKKGDLFTRLSDDVFFILGYGELVRDLAQPGREIDVLGEHRTEARQMCAECKAHQDKIGGAEVNKFRGALVGEQRKPDALPTTGYFLSLGGFKDSAWEQEKQHGKERIIFLDAPRIIRELEGSKNGHFLVKDAEAAAQAGRCVERAGLRDVEVEKIELLGHDLGYIKAVYFAHNKQVTHVSLIHADGTPLALDPAKQVIADDRVTGGIMHQLQYLAPAPIAPDRQQLEQQALVLYRNWIEGECGYIQFDGLPLDNHKDLKNPRIEKLFVPLRAEIIYYEEDFIEEDFDENLHTELPPDDFDYDNIHPIGKILEWYKHVALLAVPGGGKSTLLKRLAIAYAFEERHGEIKDDLPKQPWLPLFLRCRELRTRTEQPIMQLLEAVPAHINMQAAEAEAFRAVLHERLRVGHVLLLIDGLDEITDESMRKGFADNLRRFLISYPQVRMVVTSRIAGFRTVAGVIGQVCREAELAPLTNDDIRYLCLQWHLEFNRDSPQERTKAHRLTEQILANRSILALARNPLLLTNLLAVRRNLGELPTNRAALYRESVRLLVKTWNVEGFTPMSEREAMAQLCYVACAMMEQGIQQIHHELLFDLLVEAREVLAKELQYTKVSPEDFIAQIEYRSSLIMRVGQEFVDGELQHVYEFRHLTFQEYLAAEGYVKRRHHRRRDNLSLVELFEPYLHEASWEEVISLATVLAEDQAEPLVEWLIESCAGIPTSGFREGYEPLVLLGKCLVDEVSIEPETLQLALRQIARFAALPPLHDIIFTLWESQMKEAFEQVVQTSYMEGGIAWLDYSEAMKQLSALQVLGFQSIHATYEVKDNLPQLLSSILHFLSEPSSAMQVKGALAFTALTDGVNTSIHRGYTGLPQHCTPEQAQQVQADLEAMVRSADPVRVYAACLALDTDIILGRLLEVVPKQATFILSLFQAWRTATVTAVAEQIARTLVAYGPLQRDILLHAGIKGAGYESFLLEKSAIRAGSVLGMHEAKAAVLMGWYWREPWQEKELAELLDELYAVTKASNFVYHDRSLDYRNIVDMLLALGEAGKEVVNKRNQLIQALKTARH
jgi:hypothetical protein